MVVVFTRPILVFTRGYDNPRLRVRFRRRFNSGMADSDDGFCQIGVFQWNSFAKFAKETAHENPAAGFAATAPLLNHLAIAAGSEGFELFGTGTGQLRNPGL